MQQRCLKSDAHIVATLFKVHKQARSSHKISSLYLIDAIAREARQQVKKAARGKQSTSNSNTPLQDGTGSAANDDSDEVSSDKRRASSRGTHASFLSKIESFLDRLVLEVLSKGPPEHKVGCYHLFSMMFMLTHVVFRTRCLPPFFLAAIYLPHQ